MVDVLVVGAGPAGSLAAARLAGAGVRVLLVDRASFPRPKLCGDSLNPGALALLWRAGVVLGPNEGVTIRGMLVTGLNANIGDAAGGASTSVAAKYPDGLRGIALSRSRLDDLLVSHAVTVGAQFEPGVAVVDPIAATRGGETAVVGARARVGGRSREVRASVVIAADGRRSRLAGALGLSRTPCRPRRWAIGATFGGVVSPDTGEMHVRRNGYIGLAPLPGNVVNACVVTEHLPRGLRRPGEFLREVLSADPLLRDRMADARLASPPLMLGPLAVDGTEQTVPGLLTAGDAAGFIDPITGDGLRFAIQGGELAAAAALRALERGWGDVHDHYRRARAAAFGAKWRLNRGIRTFVGSPAAVGLAARTARLVPAVVERLICAAGDVGLATDLAPTAAAPAPHLRHTGWS